MVAAWPESEGNYDLTKQIVALYKEEDVTLNSIQHKEFVADVMYTGLYRSFRKMDGSFIISDFNEDKAEFFRWMANEMYGAIPQNSFEDRKGLEEWIVLYSEGPGYYPYNIWPNWWKKDI